MQLSVAPESNSALASVVPTLTLYVDVCVSLMCSDSISVVPWGSLAASVELIFVTSFGLVGFCFLGVVCRGLDSGVSRVLAVFCFLFCVLVIVRGQSWVSSCGWECCFSSHSVSSA